MPLSLIEDDEGEPVLVEVKIASRDVKVKIWEMTIGVIQLYLLDTDLTVNHPDDRKITGQLYGGDTDMRIKQEIILGIAGARALEAMGKKPTVYHLNEGILRFLLLSVSENMWQTGFRFEKSLR